MYKKSIKFRFTFNDGTTMEASYNGISDLHEDACIMDAWENMGKDCFDRMLILKTLKIEQI